MSAQEMYVRTRNGCLHMLVCLHKDVLVPMSAAAATSTGEKDLDMTMICTSIYVCNKNNLCWSRDVCGNAQEQDALVQMSAAVAESSGDPSGKKPSCDGAVFGTSVKRPSLDTLER